MQLYKLQSAYKFKGKLVPYVRNVLSTTNCAHKIAA